MNKMQRQVLEFHRVAESVIGDSPAIRDPALRARLIAEEARETLEAITGHVWRVEETAESTAGPDLALAIDGLCDLEYVIQGSAVAFGVDGEPFFDAVHRANMAKFPEGKVLRDAGGKVVKPPGWTPPDIAGMLQRAEDASAIAVGDLISYRRSHGALVAEGRVVALGPCGTLHVQGADGEVWRISATQVAEKLS